MRLILDEEETWSLMTLITAQVLDQVELSEEGAQAIRDWRAGVVEGNAAMEAVANGVNEALGNTIDEELTRQIRRRDYYRTVR
ncbi:MAG: hypothetical protein OXH19_10015 [Chloroflexi bacterium]|nr:hypothetical protein [Chloroflexota bacterium]MCY3589434.1 hypothetical protein [Chloroflexota bacterium]MCY3684994.1 hypothetical protein [Chloroflexota bacterium]MDE2707648.1 hypothetical protein [Chloroflexota bacterium]MDE2988618.1 hypothetical protein [Chloroflexota bacterium]